MLRHIGQGINRISPNKNNMLQLQLVSHGIIEKEILGAFAEIDREDFIPMLFNRMAYQDTEITINGSKKAVFRPYILAKILQYVIPFKLKKALIIGDVLGYSSVVFSKFFQSVTIAVLSNSDEILKRTNLDSFEKKSLRSILSSKRNCFDFIFFDSGFYSKSIREQSLEILSQDGMAIFLTKPLNPEISFAEFSFCKAYVECFHRGEVRTLFSENIFLSNSFIA